MLETPDPRFTAARVHYKAGRRREAAQELDAMLASNAKSVDAMVLHGFIASDDGELDAAERWFRSAIKVERRNPMHYCRLARTLVLQGRPKEALAAYEKAHKLRPDMPNAVVGMAEALDRTGKADRARKLVEPLATARTPDPGAVSMYSRLLRQAGDAAGTIAFAAPRVAAVPDRERRNLLFDLGRAYDDTGDYDQAFASFAAANAIGAHVYDAQAAEAKVAEMERVFAPERFAAYARSGLDTSAPVFIVGMPRSGSTLLEQILHAHPDAAGIGESTTLYNGIRNFRRVTGAAQTYPAGLETVTAAGIERLGRGYLDAATKLGHGAARIVDKTLGHRDHIGLFSLLFPNASIIHVRRHPLGNCLSIFMSNILKSVHPYTESLEGIAHTYRLYDRTMRIWGTLPGLRVLDVDYEAVVNDFEPQVRRVLDFVGLPWSDACLEFHRADRPVATASFDQVRRPLYDSAALRHVRYGRHLDPLRTALADLLPDESAT